MKAINRAGNLKRITTHPYRKLRQENAKRTIPRTPEEQLTLLDQGGYRAVKQRAKLAKRGFVSKVL